MPISTHTNIERILETNDKIHAKIVSILPDIVDSAEIEIDEDLTDAIAYVTDGDYFGYKIALSPNVAKFDESYKSYIAFKKNNPFITFQEFVEYAITHEYGHMIDYMSAYSADNFLLETKHKMTNKKNTAITEGFAFWFADTLTGLRGFGENCIPFYKKTANIPLLECIYDIYNIEKEYFGFEHVAKNSREIYWKNLKIITTK
ncbi:hypothetical protein JXM83_01895 [Candidatus Woesearchaeota archaeon]|nr:hypothetical protein [Candidatus Woesearchaeota archaeon]